MFKPLLAAPVEFDKLDYSNLWLSPKLDGVRAMVRGGVLMSRSMKPIPNPCVQEKFRHLEHYDGELILGEPTGASVYRDTTSAVMSRQGTAQDLRFYVFDHIEHLDDDYYLRHQRLTCHLAQGVHRLPQTPIECAVQLQAQEQHYLSAGYEGVMLRAYHGPTSHYKLGRATARSNTLLKVKRFTDAEAVIVGVEEEMQNHNEPTRNELGRTQRSSHLQNLVGKGRLGALVCQTLDGTPFNIGTGFDLATRQQLWEARQVLPGQFVKYKSFDIGVKTAPRFPVFLGLRDSLDL